jgi:hypothetical protein
MAKPKLNGLTCDYCQEPITENERRGLPNPGPNHHRECMLRIVIGSVSHIEHRCSCYVPGSVDSDPPGLSLRQGAQAALRAWERSRPRPPICQGNGHENN